jgi:hypothetical protein
VQQAVRDEVARFIAQLWLPEADRGALLEPELVAARTATGIRWALTQENLGDVATAHATSLLLGQDIALDINRPTRLAAVGRKDLLRVAQAWLTGEPISILAKPKATVEVPVGEFIVPGTTPATVPAASNPSPTSPTPSSSPIETLPPAGSPVPTATTQPMSPMPVQAQPPPQSPDSPQ